MAQIIQKISVETSRPNFFQAIVAKQYDSDSRFLKATLLHEGNKIEIEPDSTVTINAKRNDGKSEAFQGEVNNDGTVTVPVNFWMLELAGTLFCDISVISSNKSRLTTSKFIVEVEEAACTNGDISAEIITSIVTVVPFDKGGTNAETVEEARQNLNYLGRNPVTVDEPSAWIALASGFAYISGAGQITDQPSTNGFIESFITDKGGVRQIWHSHTTEGTIYKRAGNSSGWFSKSWTKVFDSNDIIQLENGGSGVTDARSFRMAATYLGENVINSVASDTPSNWRPFANGYAYFSKTGCLKDQPAQYGFVENIICGDIINQLWYSQANGAPIYKRSGYKENWYASSWTKVFDSNDYIPTKNGGIGANTSVDLGETEHSECVNRFVAEMNRVATNIGMSKSTFKTPSGYCGKPINSSKAPANRNYNSKTTAYDMMCLLAAARHSPSVLTAMGTTSYKYRKNDEILTQYHINLSETLAKEWFDWAKTNEYVILAAKSGSLTGQWGEMGAEDGILNYAMLIKNKNDRIFGVTVIGLKNEEYSTARSIVKGLIDKCLGGSDNSAITEAKGRADYPVGMMVTEFTSSESFESDMQRINGTQNCYHYNKDTVRVAASLTKILTAIVVASHLDNHYCSVNYDDITGGSQITVAVGDVLTTYDAFNVMLLRSCCVMATMLARDIGKRL